MGAILPLLISTPLVAAGCVKPEAKPESEKPGTTPEKKPEGENQKQHQKRVLKLNQKNLRCLKLNP